MNKRHDMRLVQALEWRGVGRYPEPRCLLDGCGLLRSVVGVIRRRALATYLFLDLFELPKARRRDFVCADVDVFHCSSRMIVFERELCRTWHELFGVQTEQLLNDPCADDRCRGLAMR